MKVLLFANTEWYLWNFRLPLARFLAGQGHEVVMVSPPGPYGERLRAAGFRWIPLEMQRRSLNPWRETLLVANLVRIYRTERPDLAHHFTIKCVAYGTLAARMTGIRAVVNAVAGLGFVFVSETIRARLLRPLVRAILNWSCDADGVHVIVQNRDDLESVLHLRGRERDNISLIPGSGVDVSRFVPPAGAREPGPLRVLFVGRLLHDKGIGEFVECARRVRASSSEPIRFLAAGTADPGNPASVPELIIRRWTSDGHVEFLGHVDDMPALVAAADLVVLPSYGEGAPRSLIEAAACEKALVATDVQGCREVVRHEVNGLLVPPRDVESLVAAVMRLCANPELRERMGRAGRVHVLDHLDERIVLRRTYGVYQSLLEGLEASRTATPDCASRQE